MDLTGRVQDMVAMKVPACLDKVVDGNIENNVCDFGGQITSMPCVHVIGPRI